VATGTVVAIGACVGAGAAVVAAGVAQADSSIEARTSMLANDIDKLFLLILFPPNTSGRIIVGSIGLCLAKPSAIITSLIDASMKSNLQVFP
jgi:hypothetical protein